MPNAKNKQSSGGKETAPTGPGMEVSGEQIFREEDNQPKVTPESDVFGQQLGDQTATTGQSGQFGATAGAGGSSSSSSSTGSTSGEPSDSAKQAAAQVTEVLRGNTTGVTNAAKDALNQAKDVAGSVAGQAFGQVQERAGSVIETQKQNLTESLSGVANSIRSLSDNLQQSQQQTPIAGIAARYTNTAADQVEQLARYFETRDLGDLARDVQNFARRNPTVFVAGAFVTGLLAARFLKSSPRQELMLRDQNYDIGSTTGSTGSASYGGSFNTGSATDAGSTVGSTDFGSTVGTSATTATDLNAGAGATGSGSSFNSTDLPSAGAGATSDSGTSGGTTTTRPSEVG